MWTRWEKSSVKFDSQSSEHKMRSQLSLARALALASLHLLAASCSSIDSVISGLVRVARCRASLAEITGSWDLCADLAPASVASFCSRPGLARDRSLASVCGHYYQTNMTPTHPGAPRLPSPGLPWHFPSGLKVSGGSVSWPQLAPATNSLHAAEVGPRSVYLVLGQDRAGQWYELTQTRAPETRLQPLMAAKLARLVVLGVRDSGVQDSLSGDVEAVASCQPQEIQTATQVTFTEDRDLTPRVISVKAFGDSGLAEVSLVWRASRVAIVQEAAYMVQWQRLPGSIIGNLVTSDLGASLTLETGSLYLVTVTDMARGRISPPTAVNTNNHQETMTTSEEQQPQQDGLILAILSLITLILVVVISVGIWIRRKFLSEKLDKTCLKNEQIVARNNIFNKTVTKARTIFTQSSLLPMPKNLEDVKCFVPFISRELSQDIKCQL